MSRRVRLTDPSTSREAAESIRNLRQNQRNIYRIIRDHGPITDEEILQRYLEREPISSSGARTRRKELVDLGLVEDSGQRGRTNSGRKTIKWKVSDRMGGEGNPRQGSEGLHRGADTARQQRRRLEARRSRVIQLPGDIHHD